MAAHLAELKKMVVHAEILEVLKSNPDFSRDLLEILQGNFEFVFTPLQETINDKIFF